MVVLVETPMFPEELVAVVLVVQSVCIVQVELRFLIQMEVVQAKPQKV